MAEPIVSGAAAAEDGFTVHLEWVFHGPLDLLLQLVRERELEIHLVSLAQVCDAYCQYVRSMPHVDVDEAADYLVVAATLLAIKSRALLPQEEVAVAEEALEPGAELVQQLLLYKALREAAEALGGRWEARARLLEAGGRFVGRHEPDAVEEAEEWDLGDVSLWDLLQIFRRLEDETGFARPHRVCPPGRPLRVYVEELWEQLQQVELLTLRQILARAGMLREDAAYYVVALLELARQHAVDLRQERPFGDIEVRRSSEGREVDLVAVERDFAPPAAPEPELEVGELLRDSRETRTPGMDDKEAR